MADYTPYAPGINAARSVWDQGIAPLAKGVQGFLKGTAGLPGAVKDYAAETVQSEAGPTTKVMVDLLTLGQGMRQGIREDPLRAMAEMYPPVGFGSDVFETGRLLKQAQNAEESGELEKAQTLRELANTIVLMGMVPGGPPAKKTIEQKLKDMEEKRRKLKEETGLPYVPKKEPPPAEGKRIDLNEPELDLLERERRLQQATTESAKMLDEVDNLSSPKSFSAWDITSDPVEVFDEFGELTNVVDGPEYALIEKVYVDPSERGQGAARNLLRESIAEIQEKHPQHPIKLAASQLEKGTDLDQLVRFYESEGFISLPVEPGMDFIPMEYKGNVDLKAAGGIVSL